MAQVNFFASEDDFKDLICWLLDDMRFEVYEAYSRIDNDIRRIENIDALNDIGSEKSNSSFLIRAWLPCITDKPVFNKISLNPNIGKHRTSLEGAGIMQFAHGDIKKRQISNSSFSYWNEAGALSRCKYPCDVVDWKQMRLWSGRVSRQIRDRSSLVKVGSAPVLKGAFNLVKNGHSIWYGGKEYTIRDLGLGV